MKHLKSFVVLAGLGLMVLGCGAREESMGSGDSGTPARRDRNAEIAPFELVNGNFSAAGGGWSVDGLPVSAGCAGPSGAPSLGVWEKNSLAFGYAPTTVSQSVRVLEPSTVTFGATAAVRGDQPNATFTISLASNAQSVSTGPQTGSQLVKPTAFSLSVATTSPNEMVTVSITGASEKYWAGCYGPIISAATLTAQSTSALPSTTIPSSSTLASSSTTVVAATSTSTNPTTTTTVPSTSSTTILPASTTTLLSPTTTRPLATTTTNAPRIVTRTVQNRECKLSENGTCSGVWVAADAVAGRSLRLRGLKASGTSFADLSISEVDFRDADLHQADFHRVSIDTANFDNANLVGANLDNMNLAPNIEKVGFVGGRVSFVGAKLAHANLGGAQLTKVNFARANLVGAVFDGAELRDVVLDGADLRGASLVGAHAPSVSAMNARLPKGYEVVKGAIVGPWVDVSEPDLATWIEDSLSNRMSVMSPSATQKKSLTCKAKRDTARRVTSITQRSSFLAGARLGDRDLSGVNFNGLDLKGASFANTVLFGASFRGADLTKVDFTNAVLENVDFSGANVSGVSFKKAKKFKNITSGCTFTDGVPAVFPENWKLDESVTQVANDSPLNGPRVTGVTLVNHGLILGPSAILVRANLNGLDLSSVDLSSAQLYQVSTASVDCQPVRLLPQRTTDLKLPTDHVFVSGILFGPAVNLCGANLVNLMMRDVNLANARLDNVSSSGLKGSPLLPSGWVLANGYLVGPGAQLTGARLGRANLSDVVLADVNLDRADFTGTKLARVRSAQIVGNAQWPRGYKVVGGFLLGPDVDLSATYVDVSRASKYGIDISDVDLSGAVLDHVAMLGIAGTPRLPDGWGIVYGGLVGPGADVGRYKIYPGDIDTRKIRLPDGYSIIGGSLVGPGIDIGRVVGQVDSVDVSGATISKNAFAGATIQNLRGFAVRSVPGATAPGVGMPIAPGWEVTPNGVIVGPGANLSGADLSNDTVSVTDLSAANLDRVRAVRTKFLSPGNLRLPPGWRYASWMLLGKTADLRGADLSGVRFMDDDLSEANLEGAFGSGITGAVRLPDGWKIERGFLVGPDANLVCTPFRDGELNFRPKGPVSAYYSPDLFGLSLVSAPYC